MPVRSPGCSKGDAVPLRYAPGSGETGSDNPLSSARRTRPRRRGAGRGIKVRQSWTFMGNLMRRSAKRLSCLFCRRQNAAGDSALWALKRHAVGVPFRLIEFALQIPARRPLTLKILNESKSGGVYLGFLTLRGRKFPHGNFRTSVFCGVRTQIVGKTQFFDSLRRPCSAESEYTYRQNMSSAGK